ncbi:MAG: hypothetical protein KDK45_22340, partial [Leptospiraceae bacterium]|nr:hypothetical protein [Leptospiraceae bacterium]
MNIWEISENRLKIIATGKGYGCIYFFLFLFGLSISSVSSLFLYSNWEKGNYPDLFLTSFFFVFGLVFISVFVNRKVINYDSVVVLDNQDKTLEYYKEEDYKIQLEYENFSHIELIKEIKYTEGKSRTAYDSYQIFLIKRDGAQFWLDSFLDADLFQEQAKKLQSFINWNMKDFSGFGLSVENKDTMRNLAGAKTYMPSKFVELKSEMEGMEIQIKKPGNFGTSFILFTIFYIFFGFPVYFLYSAFIDTKDDEVGIIFGMIALVFVSSFLSIVLLIFLLH